ncbi:MAG: hypothetical protein IH613_13525 [Desulfuromonadales bacterium]|nr:hypothetical protein [Desulfuromonadales bacterium]
MNSSLVKRLAKLEQQTGDPHGENMFLGELYARWLCAETVPGETPEQSAAWRGIGQRDYERTWPTDDAVLLQVAFDHARSEGDTHAASAETWQAERMAAYVSGSVSLLYDIEIFERAGQKNIEREQQPAE